MSLDRQRILTELGSVMNQLKSADCGCMEKCFTNQNQGGGSGGPPMGNPLPTCGGCRRGCCHGHGIYKHSAPYAGEPYSMGQTMNRPCMGQCNPPQLYADTYGYLNNNLMQPVVKEVYNDLKSINPANTIMNNPMGNQMGLSQGNPGAMAQGNPGNMGNAMQSMPGMDGNAGGPMGQAQPPANALGGMGPQIVNMMMGDSGKKASYMPGMPAEGGQGGATMGTGQAATMNMSPGANANMGNTQPGNPSGFANPPTQFVSNDNMYSTAATFGAPAANPASPQMGYMNQNAAYKTNNPGSMNQGAYSGTHSHGNPHIHMGNADPNVQQMSATNQPQYGQNAQGMMQNNQGMMQNNQGMMQNGSQPMAAGNKPQYGQHTPGMTKFNEMFPGVMQGGDLGFDPMAIAFQMNPANQQKAAMNTMQRFLNGGPGSKLAETTGNAAVMKPVMDATKTAMDSVNPVSSGQGQQNAAYSNQMGNQLAGEQQVPVQQNMAPVQQNMPPSQTMKQQVVTPGQQSYNPNAGAQPNAVPQQQVYTAATGQPMMNQQYQQQQQMQSNQQPPADPNMQYQQQYVDPNTGASYVGQGGFVDPNSQAQPPSTQVIPDNMPPPQQTFKEPIFPADASRSRPYTYTKPAQRSYEYNTLGQPVEMLPAKMFHAPEPSLPQTLSPQPPSTKLRNDYLKYSNVKSTISKTSLAGNKPMGRTPSRSQLQHIYNQYKGSQSFTQQNVKPAVQGGTLSDGKLNVPPANQAYAAPPQQIPVERVGGDTAANNQIINNQIPTKDDRKMEQVGDVPAPNKPQGDGPPVKPPTSPFLGRQTKLRNGLQDVVYTSYPTSAAWSFHGTNTYRPVSVGYNFRNFR